MQTAIVTKYGGPEVVQIIDTPKPDPKPNEILVKIKAFGITSGDVRIRSASFPPGFTIPGKLALGIFGPRKKVLGSEFSGIVEQVGSEVSSFQVGDKVIGFRVFGINAEYTCVKETDAIQKIPENLSFEEAGGLAFGASTALFFLNLAGDLAGKKLLINGASGAVGSNAVQIAKAGNMHVTGVCSQKNAEFVKSLGAEQIIDYTNVNLKEIDEKFDIIFDTVGNLKFAEFEHLLNPNGKFLQAVATFGELFAKKNHKDGKQFLTGTAPEKKEDLVKICQMVEQGQLKPSIDKVFDFQDIQKAHEYVETGRKKGSVVVKVG